MNKLNLMLSITGFLAMILGCGGSSSKSSAEWMKAKKIAGKEQRLSHVLGIAVDDKFVYTTIGGTIADQNEGMSGLRKVALDSGALTILDDGKNIPQSETGAILSDEKYVYWNAGAKIMRISKDGGTPETIAAENVGIGIDMTMDNENIYWSNHSYYSPNSPTKPSPIFTVSKNGGKPEIFVGEQHIPSNPIVDEKYVYWHTVNGIFKKLKSGGQTETIYQGKEEGVDELTQYADSLYFGFRGAGESRWSLRKISKNGGESQTLVKTFSLKPIVVDDTNVYFFDEDLMLKDAMHRISKNGGESAKLDEGYASGVIAQTKTHIYFASLDNIYSFQK